MSVTGVDLIIAALQRGSLKVLGFAATADAVGTNYIDDDSEFSNPSYGDEEFKDRFIWRYNLHGSEDAVKQVTTVDTTLGRLYIGSADNYVDQSDLEYMLLGIHPQDLLDCLATAQRKQYSEDLVMLSVGNDFDMALSGTGYWDGTVAGSVSNLTATKSSYGFSHNHGLLLTATGANGYCRGEAINVQAGRSVTVVPILRADVGTITVKFWNTTAGSYIDAGTFAYSGQGFAAMIIQVNVPVGCEQMQVEYALSGATDIAVVDSQFGPFDPGLSVFRLPEWLDETYKLPLIRKSEFRIGISGVNQAYDAYSRSFIGDYELGQHYEVEAFLDYSRLSFENGIELPSGYPLWLTARRSLADSEPLSSPSSVTTAPFEQVLAYVMWEIADMLEGRRPEDARWPRVKAEQTLNVGVQIKARPGPQKQPLRRVIRVGI